MEDDLKIIGKWKMTSTFLVNGRRLTFFANGRQPKQTKNNGRHPQFLGVLEDDLNFGKWKTTLFFLHGRKPKKFLCKWKMT